MLFSSGDVRRDGGLEAGETNKCELMKVQGWAGGATDRSESLIQLPQLACACAMRFASAVAFRKCIITTAGTINIHQLARPPTPTTHHAARISSLTLPDYTYPSLPRTALHTLHTTHYHDGPFIEDVGCRPRHGWWRRRTATGKHTDLAASSPSHNLLLSPWTSPSRMCSEFLPLRNRTSSTPSRAQSQQ